jgi:hypothetical protein
MWSDNKVCELIAVKMLHISLLNITVVAFIVPSLGRYAPMPTPSPPLKIILERVLWNGLQRCCNITPDVINIIKMPSFQYFLYLREQEKVTGGLETMNSKVICLLAKNSLTDSALIQAPTFSRRHTKTLRQ